MERLYRIFPITSTVWIRDGFSMSIDNMVFGFGVNVATILIIGVLGITTKNASSSTRQKSLVDNLFFQFIPALGSCTSFLDLFLLWIKISKDSSVMYHEWFANISQLLVWITIILLALRDNWFFIFRDPVLSFWWILKYVFWIPRIHRRFFSLDLEVMKSLTESSVVLIDIMFGVYINVIRLNGTSSKNRSIEEPFLSADMDLEVGIFRDSGIAESLWSRISFQSITQIINQGVTRQLDFSDLLQLPADMDPSLCHNVLFSCWHDEQSNNHSNPSLFKTIFWAYGWSYFKLGLLKLFNDFIGFAGPLLLNKFIKILQQGSHNLDGFVLAISLGLASILKSFLDTQYTFHLSKIKLRLRSGIMTVIYRKCMNVSLAERSAFSEGEIQTFMSIDADRIVNLCMSFHDVWSLPLQIAVALYLLYTQVKFAFVSGVAIIVLLIPVNKWISNLIACATQNMMKEKDERIRRTKEVLSFIRTLKMYGWESLFTSWLMETRSSEVIHLSTRKYLDAWCVFFWATSPTLFSFSTFGLFALMGHQLDAAMVFTCIALFNTLISPLNSFPWVINGLIDASVSMSRLSKFLSFPEHQRALELTAESASLSSSNGGFNDFVVIIRDACCSWSGRREDTPHMMLNMASLSISKGSFVVIIGEVGSGKSSLLNSILGEMRLIHGSIFSSGSISYVSQFPWILSGTVRDNILFGKEYYPERYYDVLQSCALDVDLSLMIGGDMALVGEKGANLSGGQRARLALARAIYHSSDIFLLDDVLSAVDAQVGGMILRNAILGPLMERCTRILCTHNIQAISSASHIVLMDKGCIKWTGSMTEFSDCSYSAMFFQELPMSCSVERRDNLNTSIEVNQELFKEDVANISQDTPNITEVEQRKEGMVEFSVYRSYAVFSGFFVTVIICLSAILMQASRNGNDLWISHWVDSTIGRSRIHSSVLFYLIGLCIFCMLNSFFTLVRAFSFAFGGLKAATRVHNDFLNKLSNAPVQFFDQTPSGRILNRMSSDLYTIDDSLPFILNILLANLVGVLGTAIILSYVQVIFLLLLLPFWYVYNKLQFYYRSTSRELRRLDSVSRSPIYTSFTETMDGSATIRAFKYEDIFFTRFTEYVAMYQRTSYSELTASLWLSLRLQLLAAFVISFFAIMAIIGPRTSLHIGFGSPGMVGLALSYSSPIVSLLGSFLSSFTETEKEMVSLERLIQYMEIPQEEQQELQHLSPNWPYDGLIEFQNVTLKYSPSLPPALHNISFTLAGGTQNGIVGRTGAGKSSILNALFRLFPLCGGRIMVDGINVGDVSVKDFRSRIAVVPQSPFLFQGSLRDNVDPFHQSDDLKIWSVLEKCCVKDKVEAAGGLDIQILESGISFSVGQRQLLCLARALLKSSKVLCLDECTANVDTKTAFVLKHAISSVCRGMTVITIAHRISTVLNMDTILIFDLGNLVEQGNPEVLLQDEFSRFSCFAKASTM